MSDTYGKIYNKSTAEVKENYASIEGTGRVDSNDVEVARELSSGLVDSVDHANQIAYEILSKSKGWDK